MSECFGDWETNWELQSKIAEAFFREYPEEFTDTESLGSRESSKRPNYWDSVWGKMLLNPEIENPNTFVAKKFRRRFRVPYPLFKEVIVPKCVDRNVFESQRESQIPIEFKVLIALRILGRDAVADECNELSFVGESTCHFIFKKFVSNYTKAFYSTYVNFPRGDDLLETMETYRRLGFPGCFGSIDCTHVKWAACAKDDKWKATGKESYPTLSFEAIVSHDRRCLHVSVAFLGSYNDITISNNDVTVQRLLEGSMHDVQFVLYDEGGIPRLCRGGYLMADNGYLKNAIFICPWKTPTCQEELYWSEWAESVRKDVECFFGVLKARWWYLRNGIRYHSADTIQNAFKCAAIFHNMLLSYDGLLNGNDEGMWENLNPDMPDFDSIFENETEAEPPYDLPILRSEDALSMRQIQGQQNVLLPGESFHPVHDFVVLRRALVVHFKHQYAIGDLWWPRALTKEGRSRLKIPPMNMRVLAASKAALYHIRSTLRALDLNKQTFTSRIGDGLFSSLSYCDGDVICQFVGEVITTVEGRRRTALGRGGYMVHLSHLESIDCLQAYSDGKCMASYANSSMNVRRHNKPHERITPNCRLKVNTKSKTAAIVCAVRRIPAHTELIYAYSRGYVYPQPEN